MIIPHNFGKMDLDLDPYPSGKLDPDPHQSEKHDLDLALIFGGCVLLCHY
jgi:hypothetical protein